MKKAAKSLFVIGIVLFILSVAGFIYAFGDDLFSLFATGVLIISVIAEVIAFVLAMKIDAKENPAESKNEALKPH